VTVHVFTGPTIAAAEVRSELDGAVVSGPAAFGDVYRAARGRARAIALIDGYFECTPAVWHKEILWAMSEGVHVFGASSMGALRAAELADFGMVGVGAIFEAYRAGALEDDDEVAVVHGPADRAFSPMSEAMVNLRATLAAAAREGVLGAGAADTLERIAKGLFYADRTYETLFREAAAAGVDGGDVAALRGWLPRGRVDQKQSDARLLLGHLRQWLADDPKPKRVSYRFEPTDAWYEASRLARAGAEAIAPRTGHEAIVEELKLAGNYVSRCQAAVVRGVALDEAHRAGVRPDAVALRSAVDGFRRDRGLRERHDFEAWRIQQRFDRDALPRFFEDEARIRWAGPAVEAVAHDHLLDALRATGELGPLTARAEAKGRDLAELGLPSPSLRDVGMTEDELWTWYFRERLGREPPNHLDDFARAAGFADKDEMRAAVLRERWWALHRPGSHTL
jgi:hypothetical protein